MSNWLSISRIPITAAPGAAREPDCQPVSHYEQLYAVFDRNMYLYPYASLLIVAFTRRLNEERIFLIRRARRGKSGSRTDQLHAPVVHFDNWLNFDIRVYVCSGESHMQWSTIISLAKRKGRDWRICNNNFWTRRTSTIPSQVMQFLRDYCNIYARLHLADSKLLNLDLQAALPSLDHRTNLILHPFFGDTFSSAHILVLCSHAA